MKSLVVVDIQPSYHQYHEYLTGKLVRYINVSNYENILWFWNGSELGCEETYSDMVQYTLEHGLDEDKVDDITFIEKTYGFFRGWMDFLDEDLIVEFVRYMINNDIYDSREIDDDVKKMIISKYTGLSETELESSDEYDFIINNREVLFIPQFNWEQMRNIGYVETAGGGCNECLLEIEILLRASGIEYRRLNNYTYG